jgi:hypothetical protein
MTTPRHDTDSGASTVSSRRSHPISRISSRAVCQRSSGSLATQVATNRPTGAGSVTVTSERLLDCDRSSRDLLVESLPLQILHDEVVSPVLVAHVVVRADVRMRERRERFGLALKAGFQLGIAGRQDLDGDGAIEAGVPRLLDLAEPACAGRRQDVVGDEARADGERHLFGWQPRL